MIELRVACDGGKDSLSMAAAAGGETVMAPGNLVVSAYVGVPDVTKVVTPDLCPGKDGGVLLHVDLGRGRRRLGGSALGQAHAQLGDESPDVSAADVGAAWRGVQAAIDAGLVRAGHDISDGGIVTALLEMAFAGEVIFRLFQLPSARARGARRRSPLLRVSVLAHRTQHTKNTHQPRRLY
jgi:phosphoribosylformylglycinamidine synthase